MLDPRKTICERTSVASKLLGKFIILEITKPIRKSEMANVHDGDEGALATASLMDGAGE